MEDSIKLKNSIIESFERIKSNTFDESTIKTLLIDIREFIRDQAILRELADFVAHPKRDKGISHKLINARYAKLSLVDEQFKRIEAEGEFEKANIKTEWDYSATVLSSVKVERINSRLFKILFIDGIEDIDEKTLKKHYKLGSKEILSLLTDSYFQSDGFHILKNLKHRNAIDDILKFISGFVSGKSVFEPSDFNKELQNAVKIVIRRFELSENYLKSFSEKKKDILLCIMCLLHDARFTFYDKAEGRIFLTTSNNLISLATDRTVFHFYLFNSGLKIQDYLDQHNDSEFRDMEEIPFINAKRINGKLILTS
ncbi:MAG: hypothetical protein WDN75_19365 [Bacteroidota bacterium]